MAFTDRLLAPVRRAFASERPASLSLAEKSGPNERTIGAGSVGYATGNGTTRLAELEQRYELRGTQGSRTYRRMRFGDAHIYHLRRAQNLPLMGAAPSVGPFDPDDADAVAKQEFIERVLLGGSLWGGFIRDAQLALDYGFSAFEIVWYRDAASGEVRCRLELRPASSIATSDIFVRNGAIDHVVQRPLEGGERPIPSDKLVWIAYDKEGDAFQGSPILVPMYQPWRLKLDLIMQLPIQIHRGNGIPVIGHDYSADDDEFLALQEMGKHFGQQVESYAMFDKDRVDLSLMSTNVSVRDTLDAIEQQNREITAVCQAQVFDLGITKAGSFALGKTLSDAFNSGVQSQATYIESVLNADGGLIHQLIAFNFPRDDNRPRLRIGNVETVDVKSLAQALLWMSQAMGGIPDDVKEWALRQMNMPTEGITQVVVTPPASSEPSAPAASNQPGSGDDEAGGSGPQSGAKAAEGHHHGTDRGARDAGGASSSEGGIQLAEGRTLRRAPVGAECFVQLAELDQRFTDAKTAVREATQATRDKLVAILSKRAQAAGQSGKLGQFASTQPPMTDVLREEVAAVLTEFYAAGREQVAAELDRQRKGEPVTPPSLEDRQVIAAAEKPGRKAIPAKLPDADKAIDEQAEMIARSIAQSTQAAAVTAAARIGSGVPLDAAAFAESVTRGSDAAALRFGAVVSDMMQLGRATEANAQASSIAYGVVSAILDSATCQYCEDADGFESEDLSEIAALAPNPDCEGGENCRCTPVYMLRGTEEAA